MHEPEFVSPKPYGCTCGSPYHRSGNRLCDLVEVAYEGPWPGDEKRKTLDQAAEIKSLRAENQNIWDRARDEKDRLLEIIETLRAGGKVLADECDSLFDQGKKYQEQAAVWEQRADDHQRELARCREALDAY